MAAGTDDIGIVVDLGSSGDVLTFVWDEMGGWWTDSETPFHSGDSHALANSTVSRLMFEGGESTGTDLPATMTIPGTLPDPPVAHPSRSTEADRHVPVLPCGRGHGHDRALAGRRRPADMVHMTVLVIQRPLRRPQDAKTWRGSICADARCVASTTAGSAG